MQVRSKLHKINWELAESREINVHLLGWLKLHWKGWLSAPRALICLLLVLLLFHLCIWTAHRHPLLLATASVVQQRLIVWVAAMGAYVWVSYGSNFYLCFLLMYAFWFRPPGPSASVGEFLCQQYEFWCNATRIFPNWLLQIGDEQSVIL